MNPNQKKKFTDQFRNPNGSYHIPTWLIVVMFIIGGWPIAICLLVAKIFEDKEGSAEAASAEASDGFPAEGTQNGTAEGARAARASAPFSKKKINTRKLWMILGILLCVFSVIELPDSIQYLVWCHKEGTGISYALRDVITDSLWLLGGVVMLMVSAGMRAAERKRKRVRAIVGDADYILIDEVAEALPASRGKTERILQRCVDFGLFGEKAYLDMRSDCLVIRGEAPISKKARAEAEAEARAAKAAADNMDEYERTLKELRELNDRIPGEQMSAKISRLEDLTAKIFKLAKEQPQKLSGMRKFMDYYLPTTVKLLEAYQELDGQPVQGENITSSKKEIEETIDTLNVAFEKLLDSIFEDTAMDVSSDISVLNTVLAQEGLTEDELTRMRKEAEKNRL